jgi:exosortase E/protease (VPEID-CTERM system)
MFSKMTHHDRYNRCMIAKSRSNTPNLRSRPGLYGRLGILTAVFFIEKTLLNAFVDFDRAQQAQGFGAVLRLGQHWGFRYLVAFVAALSLFVFVLGRESLSGYDTAVRSVLVRKKWVVFHFFFVVTLAPLSYLLYRGSDGDYFLVSVVFGWILIAMAAIVSGLQALAPLSLWWRAARALGIIWSYAGTAALLGTGAMQLTQSFWRSTASLTFKLVAFLLLPMMPTLQSDPATLIVSTSRFAVQIADVCSGLEGVAAIVAFASVWLIVFRQEYVFPRALLLIPLGVIAMFLLNALRISALMVIGDAGFPDVAIYGFHSQAGWIAFISVACGLVLLSRKSAWLSRDAVIGESTTETSNPSAVYLMPLLAILATGIISRAMSGKFEFSYPLRLFAGAAVLAAYWRHLASIDWRCSYRALIVGGLVFLVWILAAHILLRPADMPDQLAALSPFSRAVWISSRLLVSIAIVPAAEELAYRGFLMRRLSDADFDSVAYRSVRWPALLISAILFGAAHGEMWLPGIIAGVAYGLLLIRTARMGDAVLAHATSNTLIALVVLGANRWELW